MHLFKVVMAHFHRIILSVLLGFSGLSIGTSPLFSYTSLTFKEQIESVRLENGSRAFRLQIEDHESASGSTIREIVLIVSAQNQITGFETYWTNLPEDVRPGLTTRAVPDIIRRLRRVDGIQNENDSFLTEITNPRSQRFQIVRPDQVIDSLQNIISPEQRELLQERWSKHYFGYTEERGNPTNRSSHFAAEAEISNIDLDELLGLLIRKPEENEEMDAVTIFNLQVLGEIQDRLQYVARSLRLYGSRGTDLINNYLILQAFPQGEAPEIEVYWPRYLERHESQSNSSGSGLQAESGQRLTAEETPITPADLRESPSL